MAYRSRTKIGIDVLRCEGNLNSEEAIKLRTRLTRLLNRKHKRLLVDLAQTKRIELTALGLLMERLKTIRAHRADMKLINIRPEIQKSLKAFGVGQYIESYPTAEEAIRSFGT